MSHISDRTGQFQKGIMLADIPISRLFYSNFRNILWSGVIYVTLLILDYFVP